ncbi:MAG: acyl-CoA dehydrogenase family protein [Desulfobacterales bacterium]|nr:acyl-CoA dehydrogenase family protein [Desulfobacterales bacterium]
MDFTLSKEQRDIIRAARKFAEGEFADRALEFDQEDRFDLDLWRASCDMGFVGIFIDEAYGGAGMGFLEHCLITEEFWAVDPGIGQAVLSASFGAEILLLFGTEAQKQEILPRVVSGKAMIGTAITEPDAGSDVTSARTLARADGSQWVINGTKMFITNGTVADYILLFCQTDPDNPSRHKRYSFILVPTDTPGYGAKKLARKMGIRASDTAEVTLTDVRVPKANLVGNPGEGFYELMAFFNRTRPQVAAQGVGLARAAMAESIRHAKERHQFGVPLASFQITQFKIAEMATLIRAARNLYYEAVWTVDQGKPDHALIAMAKWYAGKIATQCADEAVQLHGGYGFIEEQKVNRLYRAAKVLEIYEGAKEVEKMIIARSLLD